MKKFIRCLLVATFLVLLASNSFAASRIGQILTTSSGIVANHTHVTTSPAKLYRITFQAVEAGASITLYDSSGTGFEDTVKSFLDTNKATTMVKIDIGEATANDWVTVDLSDNPMVFNAGIFASMDVAIGTDPGQANGDNPAAVVLHYGSK